MRKMTFSPAAVAVAALAAASVTVMAAPAQAAASECPSGKFCVFQNTGFNGEVWISDSNCVSTLKGESYPGNYPNVNDSASSIVNNTGQRVLLFENSGLGGRYVPVQANSTITNLAQNSFVVYNNDGSTNQLLGAFNDVITSFCPR